MSSHNSLIAIFVLSHYADRKVVAVIKVSGCAGGACHLSPGGRDCGWGVNAAPSHLHPSSIITIITIMDIPPSQSIYVKNINDKIKKEVLKRQLYLAFSQFGKIIDVVACRGNKLRGQVSPSSPSGLMLGSDACE